MLPFAVFARRHVQRFSSSSSSLSICIGMFVVFISFVCIIIIVAAAWHPCHGGVAWWSSSCRAGGGCVVVLECGRQIVVVVVEPIIGCHVVESDDVAPGSVVNNKVRGNGDLLRIEMANDDYVVVHHLPCCWQWRGTLDSVVYSWPVVVHWVTWHCHVIRVVVVMGDGCGWWWPMVTVTTMWWWRWGNSGEEAVVDGRRQWWWWWWLRKKKMIIDDAQIGCRQMPTLDLGQL